MRAIWIWIVAHWAVLLPAAVVVASTIASRWISYYGPSHPRVVTALRFLLSLLSLLPVPGGTSKGVRVAIGALELQVPGLSYSAEPRSPSRLAPVPGSNR
jgi:hypothetical protein